MDGACSPVLIGCPFKSFLLVPCLRSTHVFALEFLTHERIRVRTFVLNLSILPKPRSMIDWSSSLSLSRQQFASLPSKVWNLSIKRLIALSLPTGSFAGVIG